MSDRYNKSASNIIDSFDYALKGLVYAVKTQRNMKIHMITAILVLLASLFLNFTRLELITLILTITLVLMAELLNTTIELIVNLITEEHHPLAKIIKDMAAGVVLFSAITSVIIGYILFFKKEVLNIFEQSNVINKISSYPPYYSAVLIFLVMVISVFIKGIRTKNPSLEGGMPSIHTAVAFSLAFVIYFLSCSVYVMLLAVFLALMVAQSRVSSKIHTLWEVIAGAVLGSSITFFVAQVLV